MNLAETRHIIDLSQRTAKSNLLFIQLKEVEPMPIFIKVNGVATPNILLPTSLSIVTNPEVDQFQQYNGKEDSELTDMSGMKKPNNLHRKQILSKKSPCSKQIEKKRCNY